jgi:hypothetical protein
MMTMIQAGEDAAMEIQFAHLAGLDVVWTTHHIQQHLHRLLVFAALGHILLFHAQVAHKTLTSLDNSKPQS